MIVSWEITTKAQVNYTELVRETIKEIWYNEAEACYDWDEVWVHLLINTQSPDIAQGVDTGWAWDQWIMYGYATNESDNYLPLPINLAHKLSKKLQEVRENWTLSYLLPDGKTQVTVEFEKHKPIRVDTIVISNQHRDSVTQQELKDWIREHVIKPVLGDLIDIETILHINPTGKFVIGWPKWDCGLTGRKIIIDTYGWVGRHWGWAFSWKDPSKVDRSWAYVARYLAKNIVASWVCERAEIQLSYAIWVVEPTSIYVDCFGTEKVSREKIIEAIDMNFDLSQNWIIKLLDLKNPIFKKTSSYGHFWRDDVSWEKLDNIEIFANLI